MKMSQSNSKRMQKMKMKERKRQERMNREQQSRETVHNILQDSSISDIDAIYKCYLEMTENRPEEMKILKETNEGMFVKHTENGREISCSPDLETMELIYRNKGIKISGAFWCYLESLKNGVAA